jgi:hypothetical protein
MGDQKAFHRHLGRGYFFLGEPVPDASVALMVPQSNIQAWDSSALAALCVAAPSQAERLRPARRSGVEVLFHRWKHSLNGELAASPAAKLI